MTRIIGPIIAVILLGVTWFVLSPKAEVEPGPPLQARLVSPRAGGAGCGPADAGDTVSLGAFNGQVSFDEEEGYYVLQLQGARLPFRTHPAEALKVHLQAPGETVKEMNQALLYGLIGPDVRRVMLLIDPREADDVRPAVEDLRRYLGIVAREKLGGIALTSEPEGGLSLADGPASVIRLEDATPTAPSILVRGPRSGATSTAVRVRSGGRFIVEGQTYEDLCAAADFVCVNVVKMLCGSPDCPDAAACATGGSCGCG
jgi:hypothetical protein